MTSLGELIHESPRLRVPVTDKGWIQADPSGKKVYPLDLKPDDIEIGDIALALSNQCRFNGFVKHHYSVAQHSVIVADCLPKGLRFMGLLHDTAEAYLHDLVRPVKYLPSFGAYLDTEARIWKVIARKFGVPEELPEEVHVMDNRALVTEAEQLKAPLHPDWIFQRSNGHEGLPISILKIDPECARWMFLDRFYRYRSEVS